MVRPRHDITTPEADPAETIHFLRNSADQWQATAERVARQRDAIHTAARAFRDLVENSAWMDDPRGGAEYEVVVNTLDTALGTRVPDGGAEVTG